ncbi:MAG TPA: hypothetical protein VG477_02775 [Thermoanaerobaculia bacterium]|nr:hypothetical protein [Thermoanaerobaculia bacterium]
MLNLAGPTFDLGNVLFAVLQECEHQRRGLSPGEAETRLRETARRKLAEIRESYEELGGTAGYWATLEREVMETALPEYVPAAIEQTRLEKADYDLWRGGDPLARVLFGLIGLVIGAPVLLLPPRIVALESTFALFMAGAGFLYPEVMKTWHDYRHSRLLNRLIARAEKYQYNSRIHYTSSARMEAELNAMGVKDPTRPPSPGEGERTGRVVEHPTARKERG